MAQNTDSELSPTPPSCFTKFLLCVTILALVFALSDSVGAYLLVQSGSYDEIVGQISIAFGILVFILVAIVLMGKAKKRHLCLDIGYPILMTLLALGFVVVYLNPSKNPMDFQAVSVKNRSLHFDSGVLAPLTLLSFEYAMFRHRDKIEEVLLQGPGGRATTAAYIRWRLKRLEVTTIAVKHCISACTVLWSAGAKKAINPGANLLFHQACDGDECDPKLALYQGAFPPAALEAIVQPDADHYCPISGDDFVILQDSNHQMHDELVAEINTKCTKGVSQREGYKHEGYQITLMSMQPDK